MQNAKTSLQSFEVSKLTVESGSVLMIRHVLTWKRGNALVAFSFSFYEKSLWLNGSQAALPVISTDPGAPLSNLFPSSQNVSFSDQLSTQKWRAF